MSSITDFMNVEAQNEVTLQRGKPELLVVEPSIEVRKQITEILAPKYKVLFALNGRQAVDALQKFPVQTVISEIDLPVLNGHDLLRTVREHQALQQVPFIVLTDEKDSLTKVQYLANGANDFVVKPFVPEELFARVTNMIQLRRYQESLEAGLVAARIIQHAIMPSPQTKFKSGTFEYLYYPCEELSGDFLDIVEVGNLVYIYIIDVTSHGTASAQVTYLLKGLFRESVNRPDRGSISDILRRVGNGYATLGLEYSISIRVLEFNSETREVMMAGSNIPDPLIFCGGTLQNIRHGSGPVLDADLWQDSPFPIEKVQLQPGDFIYIFTDGCLEFTAMDGKPMGYKKFAGMLKDADPKTWRSLAVDTFIGLQGSKKFPDDITIGRLQIT